MNRLLIILIILSTCLSLIRCEEPDPIIPEPPKQKVYGLYNKFVNNGDTMLRTISLESYTYYPKLDFTQYRQRLFRDIQPYDVRIDSLKYSIQVKDSIITERLAYEGCEHRIVVYTSMKDNRRGRAYALPIDTLTETSDSIRVFNWPSDTLKSFNFYWE
jgi:hypothetical protein